MSRRAIILVLVVVAAFAVLAVLWNLRCQSFVGLPLVGAETAEWGCGLWGVTPYQSNPPPSPSAE